MPTEYITITEGSPRQRRKFRQPSAPTRKRALLRADEYIEIVDSLGSAGTPPLQKKTLTSGKKRRSRPNSDLQADKATTGANPISFAQARPDATTGPVGRNLKECEHLDDVREWLVKQQNAFGEKVARGFGWRVILDDTRAKAEAILNARGAVRDFTLNNDHLVLEAFEKLRTDLAGYVSADASNEVALITFIPGEGGTSMDRPVLPVRELRTRFNGTLRKMAPHWFGLLDLAFFWTISHPDGGLHLQNHGHVIAWGPDFITKAQAAAAHHDSKYLPNVTKAPVIKVVRGWDTSEVNLARLAAYLLKAPARGKNWFEYPDGRQLMNHTEKKDRFIQFLRLGQIRSMLSLEDVAFGSKDGIGIRGNLIQGMRERAQADARSGEGLHPDRLATFWSDFNGELGQHHWSVPAILRR